MTILNVNSPEAVLALRALEERRQVRNDAAFRVADEAIAGVAADGDAYVAAQIARFDGVTIAAEEILIRPDTNATIDGTLAAAIDVAIERIESFHRAQVPESYLWKSGSSEVLHRVRPLQRAGLYVPGGRAVYLSTLLMTAIPARIAGVRELVVATTPSAASRPALQYVCNRLGIAEIYRAGGAAGIAALALGTATLRRVDKIAGPGNAYVTAAKSRLIGTVGIDMTAGPTELVVICDDSADRELVQADLDAQAEHGEDSAVICISVGTTMDVRATLSLNAASIDEAIEVANRLAPEHLSIHARNAASIAERADNCGAIFCGPWSPVAAGDYIAGPNHVLPTGGSARFFSPLGVYDFVKRSNVITLSQEDLASIGPHAEAIAEFEGLPAHAASIAARRRVPCLEA